MLGAAKVRWAAMVVAALSMPWQTHAQEPDPAEVAEDARGNSEITKQAFYLQEEDRIRSDLEAVRQHIADAEEEASSYEGGLLLLTAQTRLETLKLTEALLQQRLTALQEGADFSFEIPAFEPDPERAQEMLSDIQRTQNLVEEAKEEAELYSGGLVGVMALTNLMTHRLTLAGLERRYYELMYGILAPKVELDPEVGNISEAPEVDEPGLTDEKQVVEGEELTPQLAAARESGNNIVGKWAVDRDRSPIDDFPNVRAMNFAEDADGGLFGMGVPVLNLACLENSTRIGMFADTFMIGRDDRIDVIYRIDDEPAVSTRWRMSTNHQYAGLWSAATATPFTRSLLGAEKLFIQFTESRGKRHRATFDLDGIEVVAAEVADTCGWELQEIEAQASASAPADGNWISQLQRRLKEESFYTGSIDGLMGPQTRAAVGRYQAAHELPITGQADDQTLGAMGISR